MLSLSHTSSRSLACNEYVVPFFSCLLCYNGKVGQAGAHVRAGCAISRNCDAPQVVLAKRVLVRLLASVVRDPLWLVLPQR